MKVKNAKLEWYILKADSNTREVKPYNVLGQRFIEELHKNIRTKKITNYPELRAYIDNEFKYYYLTRSEHEIIAGGLFCTEAQLTKIDAYTQLKMNLDRITEYVNTELKINFKKE